LTNTTLLLVQRLNHIFLFGNSAGCICLLYDMCWAGSGQVLYADALHRRSLHSLQKLYTPHNKVIPDDLYAKRLRSMRRLRWSAQILKILCRKKSVRIWVSAATPPPPPP
jgi:hypothetical protein